MKTMKSQYWNQWMFQPIPILNGLPPVEAAKTAEGRTLLDQLFSTYDNFRQGGAGLDMNIPTNYAKWKLCMGPGSAAEFAEEEDIFNHNMASGENAQRTTQRKERHTNKLDKKKQSIYIPQRCEVKGCVKRGEDVRACSKCKCAYYCGKDHQLQDWPRHKLECKALRKFPFGLQPKPFLPSRELEKYPLGCFPLESSTKTKCFVCHSSSSEVDITFTECCNLPICDNSHEYEMFSYSRDFCSRSHDRYTACASHHHENHEGDWRECAECNIDTSLGARSWYSTNRFCATPCQEKFLPQGSMLTFPCESCKCRMLPGHSAYSVARGGKLYCEDCEVPSLS